MRSHRAHPAAREPGATAGLFGMLVIAAYAFYAFRISVAGRPLFEDKLLKEI